MAERTFTLDSLKEISAEHKAGTQCGSCENGRATGYCLDCKDSLCQECEAAHKRVRLTRNHQFVYFEQRQITNNNPQANTPYCTIHPESVIRNFCGTCDELLCVNCLPAHENHDHHTLEETFPRHKKQITTALQSAKKKLDEIQHILKSLDQRKKEIVIQGAAIEADVNSEIEQLEALLHQLRAKCLGTLKRLTQQKLKSLEEQREEVEGSQTKLINCVEEVREKLKTIEGVIVQKDSLIKKIEHSLATTKLNEAHPDERADMDLYIKDREKLQQACQDFFQILERQSASLQDSYTTGDGLKGATIGEHKTLVFHAMTRQNKEYEGKLNLKAELEHTKSKDRVQCEVVKEQNGQYKINYQPVKRGKHELHLTVDGNPVRGSPFPISVTIGEKPHEIISKLGYPKGITVNSKGQIVLIEGGGTCVSVLTPEGEKIQTFGTAGSMNGQLSNAYGVTVDKDDNIYVVDHSNHRVQKFSPVGEFMAAVGGNGTNQLQFSYPRGISYNHRDNNLYVPDNSNCRIQVLTTDLKFVRSFGTKGSGCGLFQSPYDVAFDDANNLYVTDYTSNCVQVLTTEGRFIRAFSQKANGEKLVNPWCIAIDSSNTVYVAEKGPNIVSVFTSQGAYITTFGGEGSGKGQFKNIYGLCVDHNDSVIVSDYNNGRLQIY